MSLNRSGQPRNARSPQPQAVRARRPSPTRRSNEGSPVLPVLAADYHNVSRQLVHQLKYGSPFPHYLPAALTLSQSQATASPPMSLSASAAATHSAILTTSGDEPALTATATSLATAIVSANSPTSQAAFGLMSASRSASWASSPSHELWLEVSTCSAVFTEGVTVPLQRVELEACATNGGLRIGLFAPPREWYYEVELGEISLLRKVRMIDAPIAEERDFGFAVDCVYEKGQRLDGQRVPHRRLVPQHQQQKATGTDSLNAASAFEPADEVAVVLASVPTSRLLSPSGRDWSAIWITLVDGSLSVGRKGEFAFLQYRDTDPIPASVLSCACFLEETDGEQDRPSANLHIYRRRVEDSDPRSVVDRTTAVFHYTTDHLGAPAVTGQPIRITVSGLNLSLSDDKIKVVAPLVSGAEPAVGSSVATQLEGPTSARSAVFTFQRPFRGRLSVLYCCPQLGCWAVVPPLRGTPPLTVVAPEQRVIGASERLMTHPRRPQPELEPLNPPRKLAPKEQSSNLDRLYRQDMEHKVEKLQQRDAMLSQPLAPATRLSTGSVAKHIKRLYEDVPRQWASRAKRLHEKYLAPPPAAPRLTVDEQDELNLQLYYYYTEKRERPPRGLLRVDRQTTTKKGASPDPPAIVTRPVSNASARRIEALSSSSHQPLSVPLPASRATTPNTYAALDLVLQSKNNTSTPMLRLLRSVCRNPGGDRVPSALPAPKNAPPALALVWRAAGTDPTLAGLPKLWAAVA